MRRIGVPNPTGPLQEHLDELRNQQHLRVICGMCDWEAAGLFRDLRDAHARHRQDVHPETFTGAKRRRAA